MSLAAAIKSRLIDVTDIAENDVTAVGPLIKDDGIAIQTELGIWDENNFRLESDIAILVQKTWPNNDVDRAQAYVDLESRSEEIYNAFYGLGEFTVELADEYITVTSVDFDGSATVLAGNRIQREMSGIVVWRRTPKEPE